MSERLSSGPQRVFVIPDGQRRYALDQGIGLDESYERGARRVEELIDWTQASNQSGRTAVEVLAFWGGSADNLMKRPGFEVAILQDKYAKFLRRVCDRMDNPDVADVRFLHIGRTDRLFEESGRLLQEMTGHTHARPGLAVVLCLDWGGPEDVDQAITRFDTRPVAETERSWREYLYLARQGISAKPFDYAIRTGTTKPYLSRAEEAYGMLQHQYHAEYFPAYTVVQFENDLLVDYPSRVQRKGA